MSEVKKQIELLSIQMQYFKKVQDKLSKADKLAFLGRILAMGEEMRQSELYKRYCHE